MPRILVIDDDPLFRAMARAGLEAGGFEVDEAGDGKAGAETFHKGAFDLVIVDMYMPGQDGIDTIFELDAGSRGVPVIAVSGGHPMGANTLRMAGAAGADMTLEKGFTPEELAGVVRELLANRAKS
jgi:DNA-binding response OmpR family regulator